MKVQALLGFGFSLAIFGAGFLPAFAGIGRYPTDAEIRREIEEFRRMIPSLRQSGQFGKGRRDPALESFVKAWSKVDSGAASFLGTWHGQETDWSIYPSNVKGRACIIFRSPPKISPGASFALGYVSNGQLRANEIVTATGSNRMVFIRQRNYLGIVSVADNNQAGVLPYSAFSDSLKPPTELLSDLSQASKNKIIQEFQAAGCTASLPSDSQIATGRSPSTEQQIITRRTPSTATASKRNSATKFQTYVENKVYSISYPLGWFLTRSRRELAYITNRKMSRTGGGGFPPYFIKTDVQIISEKFQTILNQNVSSSKENGNRLVKKENIKVDGKNAVRLWFSGGETETIITFLPYKDKKTAYLATFYTTNNSKYIPVIEKIHSSFKVLN